MNDLQDAVDALRQDLPIDTAFLSDTALKDLPGRNILAESREVLEAANREFDQVGTNAKTALERSLKRLAQMRARWNDHKVAIDSEYKEILRGLSSEAANAEDFIRIQREVEELRPLKVKRQLLEQEEREHRINRQTLLTEWRECNSRRLKSLQEAAGKVNAQLSSAR